MIKSWLKKLLGCEEIKWKNAYDSCSRRLEEMKKVNPKEEYWNNKYPKVTITYEGRWLKNYGQMSLDVRDFFVNPNSSELQRIVSDWKGKSDDEKALLCQKWVFSNIKYVSDKSQFGLEEFWEFPYETLHTKRGDCDDLNILLANLMLASGIPYWKIRLAAANVYDKNGNFMGGHCFCTYFVESKNYWVAHDTTYYPDLRPVADRPDYKDSILYGKGKVWFSWNMKYAFHAGTASYTKAKKDKFIKLFKIRNI